MTPDPLVQTAKLSEIESRLRSMESKIEEMYVLAQANAQAAERLEGNSQKMSSHIDFVESVMVRIRQYAPWNVIGWPAIRQSELENGGSGG